jgi:hypothetical protein
MKRTWCRDVALAGCAAAVLFVAGCAEPESEESGPKPGDISFPAGTASYTDAAAAQADATEAFEALASLQSALSGDIYGGPSSASSEGDFAAAIVRDDISDVTLSGTYNKDSPELKTVITSGSVTLSGYIKAWTTYNDEPPYFPFTWTEDARAVETYTNVVLAEGGWAINGNYTLTVNGNAAINSAEADLAGQVSVTIKSAISVVKNNKGFKCITDIAGVYNMAAEAATVSGTVNIYTLDDKLLVSFEPTDGDGDEGGSIGMVIPEDAFF